jgi:TPR repeat protein
MVYSPLGRTHRLLSKSTLACIVLVSAQCALLHAFPDADIDRIKVAAERGFVREEVALGEAYFTGNGVPHDLKLAAHWYEKAAGSGDPGAMNQLGYFYQTGMGVTADPARAVHWYQLAAASGLLRAKVNLGVAYLFGSGVTQSTQMAEQLFTEATKAGDGTACAYLGDMYYFGVGVTEDKAAAERWYDKGVKMHDYLAEYRMAVVLSEPGRSSSDLPRVLALIRESASQGYVPAMHSAGVLILNHPELGVSNAQALSYLNEAADAGTWKSSIVLGVLARDGRGEPKNDRKAYYHFEIAAAEGGDVAKNMLHNDLNLLSARLTSEERASADKDVHDWLNHHSYPLQMVYKGKDKLTATPALALSNPLEGVHAGALIPGNRMDGRMATR